MALTISQITAASYNAVLNASRKAENQWAENAALRALEKAGFIERVSLGPAIEIPVDYRANPEVSELIGDQDTAALVKTDVLTSASYDIAQLNVPVTWTKGDEAKNPSENQKIALVRHLLENGITTHDDRLETRIFTSSALGGVEINGLNDLVSTAGTGTVGGINSSNEAWWRNQADTFVDGSDIEAAMTEMFASCAKGSGATNQPTILISGIASHTLFESQLQSQRTYVSSDEADSGYKVLAFKGAKYIFSHKGGTKIYFLNPKNFKMVVSSQYFRDKGDTNQIQGQNAFYFMIYSALQFCITNRWRVGVLDQAT